MRLFYGWIVVGAVFVVLLTAYGAQYSFGVSFSALLHELHGSRASLAGVFSLYAFGYSVFGFPAGRLTDAWGPTRVIVGGALLLGGALAAMALVRELWQPYLFYGVVAALGMGTAYVPCNSTVVIWFARRRGLAVGLAASGGSVGTLVMPPLAQLAVSGLGWRGAYLVLGATVLVVLTATAPLLRRDPESMGLHPDGDATPPPSTRADAGGLTLGAAAGAAVAVRRRPAVRVLVRDDLDALSGDRGRLLRTRPRRRDRGLPVRAGRLHGGLGPPRGRRHPRCHRQLPGSLSDLGRPERGRRRPAGRVPAAPPVGGRSGGLSDRAILRGTITAAGERR